MPASQPEPLDVSALPAPEPLDRILEALAGLQAGQYLHVLHRREPWPLFDILDRDGYAWHLQAGGAAGFEIFIWKKDDAAAAAAAAPLLRR